MSGRRHAVATSTSVLMLCSRPLLQALLLQVKIAEGGVHNETSRAAEREEQGSAQTPPSVHATVHAHQPVFCLLFVWTHFVPELKGGYQCCIAQHHLGAWHSCILLAFFLVLLRRGCNHGRLCTLWSWCWCGSFAATLSWQFEGKNSDTHPSKSNRATHAVDMSLSCSSVVYWGAAAPVSA